MRPVTVADTDAVDAGGHRIAQQSQHAVCLEAAADFLLTADQAKAIIAAQITLTKEQWTAV